MNARQGTIEGGDAGNGVRDAAGEANLKEVGYGG
jgi:hypothetical protein